MLKIEYLWWNELTKVKKQKIYKLYLFCLLKRIGKAIKGREKVKSLETFVPVIKGPASNGWSINKMVEKIKNKFDL